MGGSALTMALAQEAEPGEHLCECWLAHERLRVSEARSINRGEILTARMDTAAEVAEVAAAEAVAAEAAAAVEAVAAVEAAAAAGAAAKAAADALGARKALASSCRKSLAAARTAWPRTSGVIGKSTSEWKRESSVLYA
jgi:SWI/SNF-related matrix-associated actin-dependent regulator 1 of chromatin subfamily A